MTERVVSTSEDSGHPLGRAKEVERPSQRVELLLASGCPLPTTTRRLVVSRRFRTKMSGYGDRKRSSNVFGEPEEEDRSPQPKKLKGLVVSPARQQPGLLFVGTCSLAVL